MINNLSDLLPAVGGNFGIGSHASWPYAPADRVIVVLIDGLGFHNILSQSNPLESGFQGFQPMASAIPSTTPVSLTALGTGLNSGANGVLGATFWLPEFDQILRPLHWESYPNPIAVQPETTWFEKIARTTNVYRIGPAKYAESGLTQAALRGGTHVAAESLSEMIASIRSILDSTSEGFVYAYYPDLDKIGHVHGVNSDAWVSEYQNVMTALEMLAAHLPPATQLLITADHGMVDVVERIWIEDHKSAMNDVLRITGEPRFRHVFAKSGRSKQLLDRWLAFNEYAEIYSREEVIENGLFGNVDEDFHERIGDVVAVAKSGYILASSSVDKRVSELVGHHGGTSEVESTIPLIEMAG